MDTLHIMAWILLGAATAALIAGILLRRKARRSGDPDAHKNLTEALSWIYLLCYIASGAVLIFK